MIDLEKYIAGLCGKAREASHGLAQSTLTKRNEALKILSDNLQKPESIAQIIEKNKIDISKANENNIAPAMVDRLRLDETRIKNIASALLKVVSLPDPLGGGELWSRPSGLSIRRVSVPLGVVAMIYESRPNVTVDAAALCIKSGNAVILRGGKEAVNSDLALAGIIRQALKEAGFDENCVQKVEDITRESANILMRQHGKIDLLIPRGNASLIANVAENSKIPVIETGVGNCHIYVDYDADFEMAANVAMRSKARPSVCNAVETVLVSEAIYKEFLPVLKRRLDELNAEIRGCELTCEILAEAVPATEEDYYAEYLDFIVAVKVVADVHEAIAHINKYNTRHSEAIITNDMKNAREFQAKVDAVAVYANVSTRFTDGEEFGFGAEIGISTSKLHARGPVGAKELTTVKYLIDGEGQVR
ncbi:MAG: glutamate-5-semialdehyde dehydrogenase [Oscillospiraceae bacterium]|jgi:glutamate-5-semialdehyde dehydrogenase|nr:glutamate-5-semialdehyde dehydrogenase [Oscillospiraceae bacterium]